MIRKMLLATVAMAGLMAFSGASAEAGHCHHGHAHGYGAAYGYGSGYGGYYAGPRRSYSYNVVGPRVVPAPVYPYPVYPSYGVPYGGYAPYGSSFGVRTGNFSLYLNR